MVLKSGLFHCLVKSFIELTKLLLREDDVKFVLSEKFSQDPLEEHFGRQRRRGGNNENPTYQQFGRNELALNVMDSSLIADLRGSTSGRNMEGRPKLDINDQRKLTIKSKK